MEINGKKVRARRYNGRVVRTYIDENNSETYADIQVPVSAVRYIDYNWQKGKVKLIVLY